MLSTRKRLTILTILSSASLSACAVGSGSPDGPRETDNARAVSATAVAGPTPAGATSDGGGDTNQGAGAAFVTPSPGASTPALRYAWCLREKGLPAVVVDGNVAFEGTGAEGKQEAPAHQATAEKTCARAHPDYTPPNFDQSS